MRRQIEPGGRRVAMQWALLPVFVSGELGMLKLDTEAGEGEGGHMRRVLSREVQLRVSPPLFMRSRMGGIGLVFAILPCKFIAAAC